MRGYIEHNLKLETLSPQPSGSLDEAKFLSLLQTSVTMGVGVLVRGRRVWGVDLLGDPVPGACKLNLL